MPDLVNLFVFRWISILILACLSSCSGEITHRERIKAKSDASADSLDKEGNPFLFVSKLHPADGFDFPVGKPLAKGYYNAQAFGKNTHLGEDWNGTGGGNSDLGDPVYAIADGIVFFAGYVHEGWGNVIRIVHKTKSGQLVESFYGHIKPMLVKKGDVVKRGQKIASIGNADGRYPAHLHLEMRWKLGMGILGGYSCDTAGFIVPTRFIKGHRPV